MDDIMGTCSTNGEIIILHRTLVDISKANKLLATVGHSNIITSIWYPGVTEINLFHHNLQRWDLVSEALKFDVSSKWVNLFNYQIFKENHT